MKVSDVSRDVPGQVRNESSEADSPPFSSYGEDEDEWSESAQNEPAGGPQPGRIQPGKRVGVGISAPPPRPSHQVKTNCFHTD